MSAIRAFHFELDDEEWNKCTVNGKCIRLNPRLFRNAHDVFVVQPMEKFVAVICNKHKNDNSCEIPRQEGGPVHVKLTNQSQHHPLIIPDRTSLWDIIRNEHVKVNSPVITFDEKCPN
jgi:hypothetical protein